jgi:hypothetical protein
MAYDPVLDREMVRPRSKGLDSLRESDDPEVRARREQALAMMEAAKQKFDPANYQTLSEQNRPGVFRPVAVNMPAQQQTADTAMRMQQMASQGIRPIAMRNGGSLDISGPTMMVPKTPIPGTGYDPMGVYTGVPEYEMEEVPDTTPRGNRRDRPSSLPSASTKPARIIESPPKEKEPEKKTKEGDDDYPTGLPAIKAERERERALQREENFNMALIRAGLGIAAGKSSNALANIGEGGIAGLEQFARAEKEDRAFAAEERKLDEDRAARALRSRELAQDKALARETRVYDIASGNIRSYLSDIKDYQNLLKDLSLSEDQKKEIYGKIEDLQQRVDYERDVINQSQKRLGIDVPPFPERGKGTVSPTIDFSGLPQS